MDFFQIGGRDLDASCLICGSLIASDGGGFTFQKMANSEPYDSYASNTNCCAGYSNSRGAFWKIGVGFVDNGTCTRIVDFHEKRG